MRLPESVLAKRFDQLADAETVLQTGVLGAYRLNTDSATILAIDLNGSEGQCFIWDTDLLTPDIRACLQNEAEQPNIEQHNRLTLLNSRLDAPEVRMRMISRY